MNKLITVFCESFSYKDRLTFDKIVDRFGYRYSLVFVALTPLACYQLERLNIDYVTPEMYCNVPDVEFNPYKENNNKLKVFQIYEYEKERASIYWKKFLAEYIRDTYREAKPIIIYFGRKTGLVDELKSNETSGKAVIHNIDMSK